MNHSLIQLQDLTVIVPVWIPFDENGPSNFVDNHIKACMGSALLLQVLAAFSLTHQDCLRRQPLGHRARVHRGEAVKLVNHKLSSGMVEDSTILAVGIMCITSATLAADSVRNSSCRKSSLKCLFLPFRYSKRPST
jgi:hypothetical protein